MTTEQNEGFMKKIIIIILFFFILAMVGSRAQNDNQYKDKNDSKRKIEEQKVYQATEEEIHQEHMDYIRYCATTGNYIECMNKRPEIR